MFQDSAYQYKIGGIFENNEEVEVSDRTKMGKDISICAPVEKLKALKINSEKLICLRTQSQICPKGNV